ncbi:MAG: LacI family DNA-binding transcriptional regulator [Bacteroidota bacterium]
MKTNLASINDIAKALGVSASTVSRALKDHPDISEATRNKIKEYAMKVNYRPNALALSLKQQKSKTIGIVIPEIIHHFFSSIISGIEDIAYNKGYRVMICQSNEDHQREEINVQALLDHRVDGMLVCISKNTTQYSHFQPVIDNEVPMVFIDRICKSIETDRVITNDFDGAKMITNHLIEKGFKRIMHLGTSPHLTIGHNRKKGYLAALQENDIFPSPELILECDTPQRVLFEQKKMLSLAPDTDAIFAVNDFTAVAAMNLLRKNGYRIPQDIAVAGFGDDPIAMMSAPPLTTVKQKGYQMGQEAMLLLLQKLANHLEADQGGQKQDFTTKIFEAELKIRESTLR